jgi:hypothetical protein
MLIDLTMPGIAGQDRVAYLRAESRLASIPSAIVSDVYRHRYWVSLARFSGRLLG